MNSLLFSTAFLGLLPSLAAEYDASVPKPTHSEVSYGPHKRNVLDFWKAPSDQPTPLAFVIHGGGWGGNSKEAIHKFVDTTKLLDAGISVVAINYRYLKQAGELSPPVKAPLFDAARALQFVRSKADDWNIDKARIGAVGGSAGGCSSLWLAYRDDLAEPESDDPVARESTRLHCVAGIRVQTTLDPKQMKAWIPNSRYGERAFAKKDFAEFLAERDELMPEIKQYSPFHLLTADDPATYLFYKTPPNPGGNEKDPTHSANFGVGLLERCEELGVDCEFVHPRLEDVVHPTATDYLITFLSQSPG